MHCVCSATYSKAVCVERGAGTVSPESCTPFVGSADLFLQQGSLVVRWAASRFHSLRTKDKYVIKQSHFEDKSFSWAGLYFLRCLCSYTELECAVNSCSL